MAFLKRYELAVFFILAYAFTWLAWGSEIAEARGLLSFHLPAAFGFLALATLLATAVTGGRAAFADLIGRMARWRVNVRWYAVALLLPVALVLIALGLFLALGGAPQAAEMPTLPTLALGFLGSFILFLFTEEMAWRGFALPRLQRRYNALTASLILGLLWALWHTPLFFIPGSFQTQLPFLGFVLSTVATTIIMTWIFNHTRGSVLIAALFHTASDVAIAYSNVMTGPRPLFWLFVALLWATAVAVTLRERQAHLDRFVYPPAAAG